MRQIPPTNIMLFVISALLVTSCGFSDIILAPYYRTPAATTPFPTKLAGEHKLAHVMSSDCLAGKAVGRHVMEPFEYAINNPPRWIRHSGPGPNGKGKLYNLYLIHEQKAPPPLSQHSWTDYDSYGYSFTFHTTDADIITECQVTEQYLWTKSRT